MKQMVVDVEGLIEEGSQGLGARLGVELMKWIVGEECGDDLGQVWETNGCEWG